MRKIFALLALFIPCTLFAQSVSVIGVKKSEFNTYQAGVAQSTTVIQQQITNVSISTGIIQQQTNNIAYSTGTLQDQVTSSTQDIAALWVSTASLQQQVDGIVSSTSSIDSVARQSAAAVALST